MACTMTCADDAAKKCGGRDAISVYKREGSRGPAPTPTSPSPEPSMGSCGKSAGCFMDYGCDRVLDAKTTRGKDITVKASRLIIRCFYPLFMKKPRVVAADTISTRHGTSPLEW